MTTDSTFRDTTERDRDPDHGLYVISIAAELAGLHPQTLRAYEQRGLLDPDRSPGGDRRYSDNDLARLSRITELTGDGVNLPGVARILELEDQLDELRAEIAATKARTTAAIDAVHRHYRRDLVPTRQELVPWRHPLDFTFPTGGAISSR